MNELICQRFECCQGTRLDIASVTIPSPLGGEGRVATKKPFAIGNGEGDLHILWLRPARPSTASRPHLRYLCPVQTSHPWLNTEVLSPPVKTSLFCRKSGCVCPQDKRSGFTHNLHLKNRRYRSHRRLKSAAGY